MDGTSSFLTMLSREILMEFQVSHTDLLRQEKEIPLHPPENGKESVIIFFLS